MVYLSPEDAADYVVDQARKNPKVRTLLGEVQAFDGLQEHRGWKALQLSMQAQRDKFFLGMAKRLMSHAVIDQREIDYFRGYYDGAKDLLDRPQQVVESLEVAAKRAFALAQAEMLATEDE